MASPQAIALYCYVLGAVYVTSRILVSPAGTRQNGDVEDVNQATWFMRYAATAVQHFRLPALMTTALNAPHGVNLMWNTSLLLPGVVVSPLTLLFGPQVALTALLLIGFAGSAASMFYVLRRWQASPLAAALGGALYGFSPALINSGIGHYSLVLAMLPPLMIDRVLRLVTGQGRPVRNGIWLGLMAAGQIFISEEALVDAAIAAVLLLMVLALSRPHEVRQRVRPTAIGLGTAAVVGLVLSARGLWVQFHHVAAKGAAATTIISYHGQLTNLGTLPIAFVNPSEGVLLRTSGMGNLANSYPQPLPEYLAYLGVPLIIVLLFVIIRFWSQLPIRVAGVTCLLLEWLGMGPRPLQPHITLPGFLLPWSLVQHLPVIDGMVPDRLAILADACAAAVLAFSLDLARSRRYAPFSRWRAGAPIATGIAVFALLPVLPAPYAPVPVGRVPAGYAATFAALDLTPDARVLMAPYPYSGTSGVMRWQADTGEPASMIGGDFIAPNQPGRLGRAGRSGMTATSYYIDYLYAGDYFEPEPSQAQIRADLAGWDPAAVVAVAGPDSPLGKFLIRLFGQPTTHIRSVLGWRLRPGTTGAAAAAHLAVHQAGSSSGGTLQLRTTFTPISSMRYAVSAR
jgi:dolichyl-phosphate beta-glucosyltransferase